MVSVDGMSVPIFSARWQLREKIVTAYERQASGKAKSDLADAVTLLGLVDDGSLDLTQQWQAVQHFLSARPGERELLQIKVKCLRVLGDPWVWNEEAQVYFRFENNAPWYLDESLERHKFLWNEDAKVYYINNAAGVAFWVRDGQLVHWT
jgi:hypothetical protein